MSEERLGLKNELLKLSGQVEIFSSNENIDRVSVFTDSISEIINNIVNNKEISDKTISALYIVVSDICSTSKNPQEKVTRRVFETAMYKRHFPLRTPDVFLPETDLIGDCPRCIDS